MKCASSVNILDLEKVQEMLREAGEQLRQLRVALLPFAAIGRELLTQDNRATSEPVYFVEETRERQPHDETWQWRHRVTACLTQRGVDAYIESNAHNLQEPDSYVETGCRNQEWIDLRKACIAAAELLGQINSATNGRKAG